ncbi:hypothetical protein ACOMHN_014847 [Nucella lapillus]
MPRVTVVMPKVKKVRKIHGDQDDKGYGVEEFIDEVCLASPDEGNLVQFVLEHLEDVVEWEQVQGTRNSSRRTPKAEVKEVGLDRQEQAIQELRSQVQALQDLMKDVAGKWLSAEGKGTQKIQAPTSNSFHNRNVEWTEDGKPVCFFCKEAGHMQRRCPKRQTPENHWNNKLLNGNPSV